MQVITEDTDKFVLRFDGEENLIKGLLQFCSDRAIQSAWISGLGSSRHAVLSYYDARAKQFSDQELSDWLEITNITGNIAELNGELSAHLHGTFGYKDLCAKTGHIKELIVGATCEILIMRMPGEMNRRHDDDTGLNLLS